MLDFSDNYNVELSQTVTLLKAEKHEQIISPSPPVSSQLEDIMKAIYTSSVKCFLSLF